MMYVIIVENDSVLTVNADFYPLAHRGRHTVRGDTKVGSHVKTADLGYLQHFTLPLQN